MSKDRVGCSRRRNKGETTCINQRTIERELVEARVLEALSTRLIPADMYAAFVRGSRAEWNAEQKARAVAQDGQRDKLRQLDKIIANYVRAIGETGGSAARDRVRALIEAVVLIPVPGRPKAPLGIEVRGKLAAMLALGAGRDEAAASALAS